MNNIISRVRKMLSLVEPNGYTDLTVARKSYGYFVTYLDSIGSSQSIDIYVLSGKRTSYVVRWTSNGNLKLRLPAVKECC